MRGMRSSISVTVYFCTNGESATLNRPVPALDNRLGPETAGMDVDDASTTHPSSNRCEPFRETGSNNASGIFAWYCCNSV